MRVAVVSPVTIHHRDADDTRRLQRLLRGLAERDHEVTVCCARWWDADGASGGTMAGATAGVSSEQASRRAERADGEAATNDRNDAIDTGAESTDDRAADASADEHAADASAHGAGATTADEPDPAGDTDAEPDDAAQTDGPAEPADPDDLPPAGNPADAVTMPSGSTLAEDEAADDAPATVTVDGITYRGVVSDPADTRAFATRAPLSIRRAKPDVVHVVATPPSAVLGARVGASLARAPLLAEWYDPSQADAENWTTRQALARPRRILTPSRLTRRQLLELGADDARLRVVPNAIDVDQIRGVEPGDGVDVVYARRLDADANLESLLLGLAELRDREWSATVVGDGPERPAYEQQVRELRIDDRVTFAGACDRETRLGIYRGAHAFVQTARHCVFPTELLWALAAGCVGIVEYHAASSAHELVEGRDRGFRTTNPQETAQAIRDAGDLERRTIDESFGSFDESAVLEQYEAVYDQLREERGLF